MLNLFVICAFKGTFLALELTLPAVCGCKKPFLRERFEQACCSGSWMTRRIRHFLRQSARKKLKSAHSAAFLRIYFALGSADQKLWGSCQSLAAVSAEVT